MRVRGLQFRGLAAPPGEQRLDLSVAFSCVESPSAADARGLAWLVRALLQPDRDLATLAAWSPAAEARVAAWLVSRGEAFVLAADAAQQRLQLGRWDEPSAAYQVQSSDPAEIATFFGERCGLDRLDFELLRTWGVTAAECWPARGPEDETLRTESSLGSAMGSGSGLVQVQVELERSRAEQAERTVWIARREELGAYCQRIAEQERELAAVRVELEEQAPLAELAGEFDQRLAAFRAAQEARDSGRQEIQGARRTLLGERSALRAARDRRRAPLWLGLAALALGSALPALGQWLGLPVAALGGLLVGIAWLQLRAARRRLGRIEAVLAAQRVRERTAEQRFESETEPLRAALAALDLQGIDQLRGALDAHLALAKRAADLQAGLDGTRDALPDASAALERLEHSLAGPDPAERIAQLEQLAARLAHERAVVDAPRPARSAPDPEDLVAAAARGMALDEVELRGRLAAALPLYLSALSAGDFTHARHHASEGWVLRGPTRRGVHFLDLPAATAAGVSLAFQLALAERTAAERSAPFVIGPDLPELGSEETRALGRALRRLAGFVQVIRIGRPDPDWSAAADSLARLS